MRSERPIRLQFDGVPGEGEYSWERVKTSHDAQYRLLTVEGVALDSEGRRIARRLDWKWDEEKGSFASFR